MASTAHSFYPKISIFHRLVHLFYRLFNSVFLLLSKLLPPFPSLSVFSFFLRLPVSIRVRISSAVRGKYLSSSGHACSGVLREVGSEWRKTMGRIEKSKEWTVVTVWNIKKTAKIVDEYQRNGEKLYLLKNNSFAKKRIPDVEARIAVFNHDKLLHETLER